VVAAALICAFGMDYLQRETSHTVAVALVIVVFDLGMSDQHGESSETGMAALQEDAFDKHFASLLRQR